MMSHRMLKKPGDVGDGSNDGTHRDVQGGSGDGPCGDEASNAENGSEAPPQSDANAPIAANGDEAGDQNKARNIFFPKP